MTDTTSTCPQMGDELLPCPFCGAKPHRGLSKLKHDQLHGDPYQEDQIWCPHGHARITHPAQGCAAQEWNVRASLPQPTAGSRGGVAGLDLDAIEARANAATLGPWGIESCGEKGDGSNMIGTIFDTEVDENCERPLLGWVSPCRPLTGDFIEFYRDELVAECEHRNRNSVKDAEFIAHARTDIPALIAEVRALRASTPAQSGLVEAHLQVLCYWRDRLAEYHTPKYPTADKTSIGYIAWFIDHAIERARELEISKLGRWTGFIQAGLAHHGYLNLDEERQRTRLIFSAAAPSQPAPVAAGWKLMPTEPTQEIVSAMCKIDAHLPPDEEYSDDFAAAYRRAISANPPTGS